VTKQFSASNQVMFNAIIRSIHTYPEFSGNFKAGLKPMTAWAEGSLTIGQRGK
jgi:hypothetical protein